MNGKTRKREIMRDDVQHSFSQDLSAETVRIERGFVPIVKHFVAMGTFRGQAQHLDAESASQWKNSSFLNTAGG